MVGHRVAEYLVLWMAVLLLLLDLRVVLLMLAELFVKGIEAWGAAVGKFLVMRSIDTLLWMALRLCGIVDIRIVALVVAWSVARHAWIPPQRTALAGRRGQQYKMLDHWRDRFDVSRKGLADVGSLECF